MGVIAPTAPPNRRILEREKYPIEGKMIPLICTQCGGSMEHKYECKWCGTKYREEGKQDIIWNGGLHVNNYSISASTGISPIDFPGMGGDEEREHFEDLKERAHFEEESEETKFVIKGFLVSAVIAISFIALFVGISNVI